MVNVQEGGLAALHEDHLALVQGGVQDVGAVDDQRAEALGEGQEVLHDLVHLDVPAVVDLDQELVLLAQRTLYLLAQDRGVKDVLDADAKAGHLVHVGRADAAAGGADGAAAEEPLGDLVQDLVVGRHEVRVGGDAQLGGVRAAGLQSVDLLEQGFQVHHAAVADDRNRVRAQDAGRKELELILLTAYDDGVPGVVAAVGLDDIVDAAAKQVSGLTFAFVAPLGSDDHDCWHGILPHSFGPNCV